MKRKADVWLALFPAWRVLHALSRVDPAHPIVRDTQRRTTRTEAQLRRWAWVVALVALVALWASRLMTTSRSSLYFDILCYGTLLLLVGPVLLWRTLVCLLWVWDGAGVVARAAAQGRLELLALLPEGPTVAALRLVYGAVEWAEDEGAPSRVAWSRWVVDVRRVVLLTGLALLVLTLLVGFAANDMLLPLATMAGTLAGLGVLTMMYLLEQTHTKLLALLAALLGPTLARTVQSARLAAVALYGGAQLAGYTTIVWWALSLGRWLRPFDTRVGGLLFLPLVLAGFYAAREVWVVLMWWLAQRRWGEALAPAHAIPFE